MIAVEVVNLGRSFDKKTVLKNINFKLPPGQAISLMGPNGSGKTTLLRMLSTEITASTGDAFIAGQSLMKQTSRVRQVIAHMPTTDRGFYSHLTGEENLQFFFQLRRLSPECFNQNLKLLKSTFPLLNELLKLRYQHYSTGMRQLLHFSRVVLSQPQVLLLDEPTKGLDQDNRQRMLGFFNILLTQKSTIIWATHHAEEVESLKAKIFRIENHTGMLV